MAKNKHNMARYRSPSLWDTRFLPGRPRGGRSRRPASRWWGRCSGRRSIPEISWTWNCRFCCRRESRFSICSVPKVSKNWYYNVNGVKPLIQLNQSIKLHKMSQYPLIGSKKVNRLTKNLRTKYRFPWLFMRIMKLRNLDPTNTKKIRPKFT